MGQSGRRPHKVLNGVQVWTQVVADPGLKMMNPNQSLQSGPGESWQCHRGRKPAIDGRNWKNSCPQRQLQGGPSHYLPLFFPWCVHHAGTRQIWTQETTSVIIQEFFPHHISSWKAIVPRYPSSFLIMHWTVRNPILVIYAWRFISLKSNYCGLQLMEGLCLGVLGQLGYY